MNAHPNSPDEPTIDDLAAFALDALEPDEARAVADRIAADPDLAATERALRAAAGEVGASGAVPVDAPPPAGLRSRLLAAARDRRPAAAATGVEPAAMHRIELSRALGLFRSLPADAWRRPLDPPEFAGWTVHDLVVHLASNEALLAQVLGAGLPVPETDNSNEPRTVQAQARHRGLEPRAAVEELEAAAEAVDRRVSSLDDQELERVVTYWGLPMSIRATLTLRAFEAWTHADDIRRAAGLPESPPPARVLHTMSRAAIGLVPLMLQARGIEPPARVVRFHLTGPIDTEWDLALVPGDVEPAGGREPDTLLTLDTVAFCRAVSDRIPAGGLPYGSHGDDELAGRIVSAIPALATL
jgi:uncharacterized protein (TIGR03083 family)